MSKEKPQSFRCFSEKSVVLKIIAEAIEPPVEEQQYFGSLWVTISLRFFFSYFLLILIRSLISFFFGFQVKIRLVTNLDKKISFVI